MAYINNVTDTLYADVSQFQSPVTSAYTANGYQVLAIRSNDGTYVDANFAANYQWCVQSVNAGQLAFFIVYYYWRPGGTGVSTHQQLVSAQGGPHPLMVSMMDVESGDGNGAADVSDQLTSEYNQLGSWLSNPARVIGYANSYDYYSMWPSHPPNLHLVAAGYGQSPNLPNQIAHQYTDGTGFGAASGLPDGAPPWVSCDMNSADGLSVGAFAGLVGVGATPPPAPAPTPAPPTPVSVTTTVTSGDISTITLPTDSSIDTITNGITGQFITVGGP